jgi:hypothetical protein
MPILARRQMGAVVAAASWKDRLDLWLLKHSWGLGDPGANLFGTLGDGQKRALIVQETEQLIHAGSDPISAARQATYDQTGVLISDNADPSQASLATVFQAAVDTALTGSPFPSGTAYDVVTGAGQPAGPPSWLSQNWMWLLGFGIVTYVLYDKFA